MPLSFQATDSGGGGGSPQQPTKKRAEQPTRDTTSHAGATVAAICVVIALILAAVVGGAVHTHRSQRPYMHSRQAMHNGVLHGDHVFVKGDKLYAIPLEVLHVGAGSAHHTLAQPGTQTDSADGADGQGSHPRAAQGRHILLANPVYTSVDSQAIAC